MAIDIQVLFQGTLGGFLPPFLFGVFETTEEFTDRNTFALPDRRQVATRRLRGSSAR